MFINITDRIQRLDIKIESILGNMVASDYEKIDQTKQIPLLSYLKKVEYSIIENEIIETRKDIISFFVESDSEERIKLSNTLKKFEYFDSVFIPNLDLIEKVEDKEKFIHSILICISIQDLNDDIRDLIIYTNKLKKVSLQYGVDFKKLLRQVIPLSSSLFRVYSVSMKEFFERYLKEESIPVIVNVMNNNELD